MGLHPLLHRALPFTIQHLRRYKYGLRPSRHLGRLFGEWYSIFRDELSAWLILDVSGLLQRYGAWADDILWDATELHDCDPFHDSCVVMMRVEMAGDALLLTGAASTSRQLDCRLPIHHPDYPPAVPT